MTTKTQAKRARKIIVRDVYPGTEFTKREQQRVATQIAIAIGPTVEKMKSKNQSVA